MSTVHINKTRSASESVGLLATDQIGNYGRPASIYAFALWAWHWFWPYSSSPMRWGGKWVGGSICGLMRSRDLAQRNFRGASRFGYGCKNVFVCFFVFLFFFCDRNASQTPIDFLPLSTASPLYFLLLFSVQPCRACRALVHRTENFSRGHHKNGEGSMVFLECGPLSSATYASPLSLPA